MILSAPCFCYWTFVGFTLTTKNIVSFLFASTAKARTPSEFYYFLELNIGLCKLFHFELHSIHNAKDLLI